MEKKGTFLRIKKGKKGEKEWLLPILCSIELEYK